MFNGVRGLVKALQSVQQKTDSLTFPQLNFVTFLILICALLFVGEVLCDK